MQPPQPLRNPRRERAAQEYAVGKTALEAMTLAGYAKPRPENARRLVNSADVRARVKAISLDAAELAGVHAGRQLLEAARIALSNLADYIVVSEDGRSWMLDLRQATREQMAAVQELGFDSEGRPKIKLHDKSGMVKFLLERLLPERAQRLEVTGADGGPVEIEDASMSNFEIARRIARVLTQGAASRAAEGSGAAMQTIAAAPQITQEG